MSGTGGSASRSDCESDESEQFVSHGGKRVERVDDPAPSNFGAPEQTKLVSGTGGSANGSVPDQSEDAESNGSEDSSNSLAIGTGQWRSPDDRRRTTAKVLMMLKTEREAAANVERILVREAGLDPAKHFKLAEQLARALLHAQTVERDFWPKNMNARELESMRGRHSDKISQHMDVPADMLHLLTDGRFWTRILEAALHGSPGMLPVKHSSTQSVLARMDPTRCQRGTQDDHAHLFTLNNSDKMLLLVGVTHWQWINAANGTFGFYNRMFALAVRSAESDDDRSLEDYEDDPEDISDFERDSERDPEFAANVGAIHRVYHGKHCYPPDAEHPEVVWQVYGDSGWDYISGPGRPGYWKRSPLPVMKMSPVQDGDRMEWNIRSVRPVREGVYSGKFRLEIEDRELCQQLDEIIETGSKLYERKDPTAMRRFLRAVTDRLEEVLHQAGVIVVHQRWASRSDWVSFDEVNEEGRLSVDAGFPSHDKDSGPRLKCELELAKSVLIANITFEFVGDHGPSSPQDSQSSSSHHVRLLDQLLGFDGSKQVTAAIQLSMNLSSRPVTVQPAAKTEWLLKKKNQPTWMRELDPDCSNLSLFGPVLELLAAGALSAIAVDQPAQSPVTTERFRKYGCRGMLQSTDFLFSTESDANWMIVSVERKLMETKFSRKDDPPLEPEEIFLKITVQKGEASPSIASDGHSAKRLLLNYLRENSLCVDNAAKLFKAFKGGGEVSLETYNPWYRLLFAGKGEALRQRFSDMIQMLCLCTGGGNIKSSSPLNLSTEFVCGNHFNSREVPFRAEFSASVEADNRPDKQVCIRLCCPEDDRLYLQLRVQNGAGPAIGDRASLASAVQNVSQDQATEQGTVTQTSAFSGGKYAGDTSIVIDTSIVFEAQDGKNEQAAEQRAEIQTSISGAGKSTDETSCVKQAQNGKDVSSPCSTLCYSLPNTESPSPKRDQVDTNLLRQAAIVENDNPNHHVQQHSDCGSARKGTESQGSAFSGDNLADEIALKRDSPAASTENAGSDNASEVGSCNSLISTSTLPTDARSLKRVNDGSFDFDTDAIPESAKPALADLFHAVDAAHAQAEILRSAVEAVRNALSPGLKRPKN